MILLVEEISAENDFENENEFNKGIEYIEILIQMNSMDEIRVLCESFDVK